MRLQGAQALATGRVVEVRDKFSVVEVQKAAAGNLLLGLGLEHGASH